METKKEPADIADLDVGRAVRILMADRDIKSAQLGFEMKISSTKVSRYRREKILNGADIVALCEYFKLSAVELIKTGQRKQGSNNED